MFLRIVRARGGEGVQHEYVRLVESYREQGRSKQRVVQHLGRKDVLEAHLEDLIRLLRGEPPSGARTSTGPEALGAWDYGPVCAARALWEELGLDAILCRRGGRGRAHDPTLSDRALVLVANRLCAPSSEHGLARWLETDFVCDRHGRRFLAQWREDEERLHSRSPRVRVQARQLAQWYRTLDELCARKSEVERELFLRLRTLFALKPDLVLYDLTSTYFEGQGPAHARHGYSRDGRPRNRQVLVGVVVIDGWPIAHHVFPGNWRDATTVPTILSDLAERFGLRRIILVGDRGMVTHANLERLRTQGQGYLVGRTRRRSEEVYRYIESASGAWIECPPGITAREKATPPRTLVQEVPSQQSGVRIFVVQSDERLGYEQAQREKAMAKVRAELERLEQRVREGRLKTPAKIGAAAARILTRNHGHRYYDWEYQDGTFRFFEHPVHLPREKAYEGKYVIQTEEPELTPVQAVQLYKQLSDVERAFANLKDVIELRPIYHQKQERVEAHIFVAALALLLHRALERKLRAAALDLSATEALQALRTVRVVDLELGEAGTKRCVTRGSPRAARIVRALGLGELAPPTPPAGQETLA
jgi:transposase